MATQRFYKCERCGRTSAAPSLFDTLLRSAQGKVPKCSRCGAPSVLRLVFDFGLGARNRECTVLRSFLPRRLESWSYGRVGRVTFYPFLVLLQRHGRDLAIWLPYWHTVEGGPVRVSKYGQWAPFMDAALFADLLAQAKENGFELHRVGKGLSNYRLQATAGGLKGDGPVRGRSPAAPEPKRYTHNR